MEGWVGSGHTFYTQIQFQIYLQGTLLITDAMYTCTYRFTMQVRKSAVRKEKEDNAHNSYLAEMEKVGLSYVYQFKHSEIIKCNLF